MPAVSIKSLGEMASTTKDATSPAKKKKGVMPVFSVTNSHVVAGEGKYMVMCAGFMKENPRQTMCNDVK